jgi:biotin transport system substrate-specific component
VAKKRNVPSYPLLAVAMVAGLAACYLLGTIWFIHLTGWTIGKALMTCVIVFLPGDALKIFAASILVRRIWSAAVRFRANV